LCYTVSGVVTLSRWPSGLPDGHLLSVTILRFSPPLSENKNAKCLIQIRSFRVEIERMCKFELEILHHSSDKR